MKAWLSAYKSEALSSLLSLILLLLGWALPGVLSPSGEVKLSKEQAIKAVGMTVALVIGVVSYTFQLWMRDRKRERIRLAVQMGRRVCAPPYWCESSQYSISRHFVMSMCPSVSANSRCVIRIASTACMSSKHISRCSSSTASISKELAGWPCPLL